MTEGQFELNLARMSKHRSSKEASDSLITSKHSQTERSQKYIPREFRDKHLPEDKLRQLDKQREQKTNNSFIHAPFRKHTDRLERSLRDNDLHDSREWDSKRLERKLNSLKQVNAEMPKLRETSSTQCQSPKAHSPIPKALEFQRVRLLGKGKFGDVHLVRHYATGFIGALKIINKLDLLSETAEENQKALNQLLRQIKIQSFLNHPNLIKIYDFFSDQQNVYLLLELACDGHLFDFLQRSQGLTEESTSIIVREITEGVDYMHKRDIIHRDIKLENIVLSHGMAKICDFGWSVYCPKEFRSTLCGTPLYLSPEILVGKQYNKKIDTWAIGALTHQLATNDNPFKIKSQQDLARIITEDFEMQSGSPELRSFITFILRKNPAKRPDTDTILRHPFIDKFRGLETSEELCRLVYGKKKK